MAETKTERKVTVILAADVVGYSTKMEENEEQTLKNLKVCRNIVEGLVNEHHGRIFNTAGDSVLAEFQSAVEAVICGSEFQNTIRERNNSVPEEEQMEFRIGINMAESSPRRKLAVILATDIVGYSTKMEENEEQTLKNLKVCRNIVEGLAVSYTHLRAHET